MECLLLLDLRILAYVIRKARSIFPRFKALNNNNRAITVRQPIHWSNLLHFNLDSIHRIATFFCVFLEIHCWIVWWPRKRNSIRCSLWLTSCIYSGISILTTTKKQCKKKHWMDIETWLVKMMYSVIIRKIETNSGPLLRRSLFFCSVSHQNMYNSF